MNDEVLYASELTMLCLCTYIDSVVAYKRYFFRNMASKNSREALGVRHAFSCVDIGRVRGFEPKKRF